MSRLTSLQNTLVAGVCLSLFCACGSSTAEVLTTDAGLRTPDEGEADAPSAPVQEPPRYRSVQVVLESWNFRGGGLHVEPPGDLELQIGWSLAYPERTEANATPVLRSTSDVLQKGDIKGDDHLWTMNHTIVQYDAYCGDPQPQLLLSMLEVDEGFNRSGAQARAALGAASIGVGLAFPLTGAVFAAALVYESLLVENDNVGRGEFTIEEGENAIRVAGSETSSIVTVDFRVLSGSCPE